MTPELPRTVAANIEHFTGRTWLLPRVLEWLERCDDRLFLLTGDPGTGKSAVVAWFAGAGPLPADPEARARLDRVRGRVGAAHFCVEASGNTAPKAFAQNLAGQLTRRVTGFGAALAATFADQVTITAEQHINRVEGGQVTGVHIERLDLGALEDEPGFNRALREPLKKLYQGGIDEPVLLLVDALDEAATYTGSITLVRLLARLADLPTKVRLLVSTRPDPRVLKFYPGCRRLDLLDDAPADKDDVRLYAGERLKALQEEPRARLQERVAAAAAGNFLYAHLVLNDLTGRLAGSPGPAGLPLPAGLGGLYHEFLNRELGADEDRWHQTFKPILGLIAVAQGEGLTLAQVQGIGRQGDKTEPALRACAQYLAGELPEGPFRPFHKSFAEFLLQDKENNTAYRIDGRGMHRRIADYYWGLSNGKGPWCHWDGYALRYAATHLAEAMPTGGAPELGGAEAGHRQAERLVRLVADRDFQKVHKARVNDLALLHRDLQQALRAAAGDADARAVPLVVEAARALVAFRQEELRPGLLFDLASRGEAVAAARRLDLFELEPEWRQAAVLIIAWLGADASPDQARALRARARGAVPPSGPLALLIAWLGAALEEAPTPALSLPPPPPEVARAIVDRMGGMGANAELLNSEQFTQLVQMLPTLGLAVHVPTGEMMGQAAYLAEYDGPLLVAYAAAHPTEGDALFDKYLGIHTDYHYVQYRNRSLWLLLNAVLRHRNPGWVRARARAIAEAALAGSALEFREALPLTLLALRALAGEAGALQALEGRRDQALAEAGRLAPSRTEGDTWGTHTRRLAALAQAFSLVSRPAEADNLLMTGRHLPYGFAGFRWLACLALAEASRVCRPGDGVAVAEAVAAAERAAHNVQDPTFCARSTARCNAMREFWWGPAGFDVAPAARSLAEDPSAPRFAALHRVGESYAYRSGGHMIPLPWLHQDNTLQALAEIYQQPLAEFQRVNGPQGWSPQTPLPSGTPVLVPDPGFATLLATRFAAEALVTPALGHRDRVMLVQGLVPVAAGSLTALDALLARLLLAARPTDAPTLDALEGLAGEGVGRGGPLTGPRKESRLPS